MEKLSRNSINSLMNKIICDKCNKEMEIFTDKMYVCDSGLSYAECKICKIKIAFRTKIQKMDGLYDYRISESANKIISYLQSHHPSSEN